MLSKSSRLNCKLREHSCFLGGRQKRWILDVRGKGVPNMSILMVSRTLISCQIVHTTKSLDFSCLQVFIKSNKYQQSRSFCLCDSLLEHSIGQPISLLVLLPRHIAKVDLAELRTQDLVALHELFQHRLAYFVPFVHKLNGQFAVSKDVDESDSIAVGMRQKMAQTYQLSLVVGHFAYPLADAHYCGVFEAKVCANRALAGVVLARTVEEAFVDCFWVDQEGKRLEGRSTQKLVLAKDLIDYFFPFYSFTLRNRPFLLIDSIQVPLQYLNPLPSDRLLEILQLEPVKPLSLFGILTHNHLVTPALLAKFLSPSSMLIQDGLLEPIHTEGQNSFLRHLNYNQMKNNRDYASKTQHKFQNKLNKYVAKSRLRHTDEIIRINHDRMRKMERENQRNEVVAVKGDERRKFIVMGLVCLVLMLVSMFAILSRKIETETKETL